MWGIERLERLEDARADWDRLAEGAGHPFATWEWIHAWWHFFGEGKELFSFACRDDAGDVRAILPFYLARERPLRIARFIGYGSLQSLLCTAEDRPAAAQALKSLIGRGKDRARLLYAERLPGEQGWDRMLGGQLVGTHPDPVIKLDGRGWDEFLASLTTKMRKKLQYEERRLVRDHDLTFRVTEDPEHLDRDLDILFRLHEANWGERTVGVFEGDRGLMHRMLASGMLARGWLRLWTAEADGAPVASYLAFRYAGSDWLHQAGRDPEYDRLSVGSVMIGRVIRDACESGAADVRFLSGAEPYKLRLANDDYLAQTLMIGGGVVGRAAAGAAGPVLRAPDSRLARAIRGGAVRD